MLGHKFNIKTLLTWLSTQYIVMKEVNFIVLKLHYMVKLLYHDYFRYDEGEHHKFQYLNFVIIVKLSILSKKCHFTEVEITIFIQYTEVLSKSFCVETFNLTFPPN